MTGSIAPVWHTVVLAIFLLLFSFFSARSQHTFTARHGRVCLYAMSMGWEWLMVLYVALGTRRRLRLRDLVSGRWQSGMDILRDLGVAIGFWVAAITLLAGVGSWMGLGNPHQMAEARQKLSFLIPRTHGELLLFLGVSATAGFCEEILFRGYFQRQFAAFTRSASGGLMLQAVLFGAAHAYEGGSRMMLIAIYGILLGLLAMWCESLRPGMLAHFLHDTGAAFALRRLL